MKVNLTLRWWSGSHSLLWFTSFLVSCDKDLLHLFGTVPQGQGNECSHFPITDSSPESSGVPRDTSVDQVSRRKAHTFLRVVDVVKCPEDVLS